MMKRNSSLAKGKCVLTAVATVIGMATIGPRIQAQTFSVVHNFSGGNDGAGPLWRVSL